MEEIYGFHEFMIFDQPWLYVVDKSMAVSTDVDVVDSCCSIHDAGGRGNSVAI